MFRFVTLLAIVAALLTGCANYDRHGMDAVKARQFEQALYPRPDKLTRAQEDRILALNPERVTEADLRTTLANAPAPRVLGIHGGLYTVHRMMVSFGEFLTGMGYPGFSVKHPGDGTYSFSCYEDAEKIAGAAAWYYEHEGMRPMMVGHSQGGMQIIKVLGLCGRGPDKRLAVWNPLTWRREARHEIRDPLTGQLRPAAELEFSYCAAVGAGGATRFLPNQWDLMFKLRKVPDSVVEFTGFYTGPDILGGDNLGYGSANHFHSAGRAKVRNVELPTEYDHGKITDTEHLAKDPALREWINHYEPVDKPRFTDVPPGNSRNIQWAGDVWHSIKRHWVLELQRLIRARRAHP